MSQTRVFINGARCEGCNIDMRWGHEPRATFEVSKAVWVESDLPDPYRAPIFEPLAVVIERDTPPPADPQFRKIRLVGWKSFKALLRQMWDIIKWDIRVGADPEYATRPGIARLDFPMVLTMIEYATGTPHLVVTAESYMSFLERRTFQPTQEV